VTESPDDQIIVAVRRGSDETARWWLQPEDSGWQIAPRSPKTSKTT